MCVYLYIFNFNRKNIYIGNEQFSNCFLAKSDNLSFPQFHLLFREIRIPSLDREGSFSRLNLPGDPSWTSEHPSFYRGLLFNSEWILALTHRLLFSALPLPIERVEHRQNGIIRSTYDRIPRRGQFLFYSFRGTKPST